MDHKELVKLRQEVQKELAEKLRKARDNFATESAWMEWVAVVHHTLPHILRGMVFKELEDKTQMERYDAHINWRKR